VREGEVLGKVGNFLRREGATTYHLHFDMQVPTKNGWVFVNPYMSLVAAYERQIQGRGQELREDGTPVRQDADRHAAVQKTLPNDILPARVAVNPDEIGIQSDDDHRIAPDPAGEAQKGSEKP
jgi:murein DD-endopeptidase MepM/ murein hydrolase activator NlpD